MMKLRPITLALKGFFLIKENKGFMLEIISKSTNQRPVFIHCSENRLRKYMAEPREIE